MKKGGKYEVRLNRIAVSIILKKISHLIPESIFSDLFLFLVTKGTVDPIPEIAASFMETG
jgi:hypothetical protein